MNPHALEVLDLASALELVGERASTSLGRDALTGLRPSTDRAWVVAELARVGAVMAFCDSKPSWGMPPLPDPRPGLQRMKVDGGVLEPTELHRLGALLEAGRLVGEGLDEGSVPAVLEPVRARLLGDADIEQAIARAVDAQGEMLDTASKELRRIRAAARSAHTRIVRALEGYVRTLPSRFVVEDASVTVRDGRYVIPLRREGRGHVGGVVHDESATGATVFVEPPVAVEAMNDLRDLERDEQREIQRILRGFSERLRPLAPALVGSLRALVEFDTLLARARAALMWRADPPEILPDPGEGLRLVGARHPGLLAKGVDVVPYDLVLAPSERTMVVSGPNTGGKSVFLKALGLVAALTQCGVVPPVRKGTALPVFDDLYADIGDGQSIADDLSTFSAHLETLREILDSAGSRSLVLVDEMGTGTDPVEGAALSRAVLEELTSRGGLTVVTSHLGALKTLDAEGSGVVNASLQFDSEAMAPTYRLIKGRPGRSYGLVIARRLGFPAPILGRAQALVDDGSASLDDLLERLERREAQAEALVDRLEGREEEVIAREKSVEDRERDVGVREKGAERKAKEEARELLLAARSEVEAAIREVREAGTEAADEAARRARRRVEEAARRHVVDERGGLRREGVGLSPGVRVRLPGGATKGTVLELRDDRVVVEVSGLRMEMAAADVVPVEGGGRGGQSAAAGGVSPRVRERGWAGDLPDPSAEVDLRGLRVDEVALPLGRGLDAAVLGGLSELRVIHGKGTGAVRARTHELLERDGRVQGFRLGVHGEGGGGVTVVRLG